MNSMPPGVAMGPSSRRTWSTMLCRHFLTGRLIQAQHDKGLDRLALERIGHADDGRLGHGRMGDQRRFHIRGADAMAGHIEHVVAAAQHGDVAALRPNSPRRRRRRRWESRSSIARSAPWSFQMVRIIWGKGRLSANRPPLPLGTSAPVSSTMAASTPGRADAGGAGNGALGDGRGDGRPAQLGLPPVVGHKAALCRRPADAAWPSAWPRGSAARRPRRSGAGWKGHTGSDILRPILHKHAHRGRRGEHDVDAILLDTRPEDARDRESRAHLRGRPR